MLIKKIWELNTSIRKQQPEKKSKEMILPLIDSNNSLEVLTPEEGTTVEYHEGGDTYLKVIISKVHTDDPKDPYYSVTFDDYSKRQTEACYLNSVETGGSSFDKSTESSKNGWVSIFRKKMQNVKII